jgi:hypothetical protein
VKGPSPTKEKAFRHLAPARTVRADDDGWSQRHKAGKSGSAVTTRKPPNPEAADDPHLDGRPAARVQTAPLCLNHLPTRPTWQRGRFGLRRERGQSEVLRKSRRASRGNPGGPEVGMSLRRVPLTVCRLPPASLNLNIAHGITSSVPAAGRNEVTACLRSTPDISVRSRIVNPLDRIQIGAASVARLHRVPFAGSVLEPSTPHGEVRAVLGVARTVLGLDLPGRVFAKGSYGHRPTGA